MFPSNIIAGMFNFKLEEFFAVEDEKERAVPKVEFLNLNMHPFNPDYKFNAMWELIQANRRKSLVLFISLGLTLILLGYFFGGAILSRWRRIHRDFLCVINMGNTFSHQLLQRK